MKFYNILSYRPPAHMIKFLFIMKLIVILMTTVFLQISLATEAQKVSLSEKNTPLEKVFRKIRIQTGYDFFCDISLLKNAKNVTIDVKNVSIEEALKLCLLNQHLTYIIDNKIIVIKAESTPIDFNINNTSIENISGQIVDENGQALPGATIVVKRLKKFFIANEKGEFSIDVDPSDLLIVSYIGYETREIKVADSRPGLRFTIQLKSSAGKLKQVEVVSTGYQDLPKERATGSFQVISAKQLEHSTNTNLLKRLEGITTGLDFNNNFLLFPTNSSKYKSPPLSALTIRGKNYLQNLGSEDPNLTSGQPLVVIDGIANPYSIDRINPNDVESINILQDAAAASIWGSRAANGVIVIKTKRGNYQSPTSISFNANLNLTDKMDLFYKKMMSTSDFIDAQIAQLNYNYSLDQQTIPDPTLPLPQVIISPVAEIWNLWKKNELTDAHYQTKLNSLRDYDLRNDLSKYFLRKAITQSYSLAIDGGSNKYAYRLSGALDKTQNNTIQSDADRVTVNYSASVKPLKDLQLNAAIGYTQENRKEQGSGTQITGESLYPYTRLADDQGNPVIVPRGYRPAFLDLLSATYGDKILDMTYRPLEDIYAGHIKYKNQLINLNLNASYKINSIFSGNLTYSNVWGLDDQIHLRKQDSYFMRDLINRFTDPATLIRVIPLGGLYMPITTKSNNQTFRGQLNADKTWAKKHVVSAIIGIEANQNSNNTRNSMFYGYDEKTLVVNNVLPFGTPKDLLFMDPLVGSFVGFIPYQALFSDFKIRTFNAYSNAAYTYDSRYTLSASFRSDFSSVFGRGTNEHGASYFSVGGKWSVSNEKFYHIDWLPNLHFRATFGYNGNVNASVTARPLITYTEAIPIGNGLPYATAANGSNRALRPEKAAMINLALSFGTRNKRLSGNIEYYIRKTTDLIAPTSLDPGTGFDKLPYNAGNLRGSGIDISLNSLNLQLGEFSWNSNFLFSKNRVKVTRLFSDKPNTAIQLILGRPAYNVGSDLSRIFAFRWAGLDPQTGDPMGYDSEGRATRITGDQIVYNTIANASASSARYFGSAVPVYYGSFRNTFNYGSFSASINFLYKLGYYFRRPISEIVGYSTLLNENTLQGAEYANRWQKPGDEQITNVPSMIFPVVAGGITSTRDQFYKYADINVLKGDHVRLQEINLSYTFKKSKWILKNPRIYANINNLGIIWSANQQGLDPDITDYPQPKTYSLGLNASF